MGPLCYRHRNGNITAFAGYILFPAPSFRAASVWKTAFAGFSVRDGFPRRPLSISSSRGSSLPQSGGLTTAQAFKRSYFPFLLLFSRHSFFSVEIIFFHTSSRIRIPLFISFFLRSSPRPISIGQLHALLRFHLRPINLVVFKGSYYLTVWDILSWGEFHA